MQSKTDLCKTCGHRFDWHVNGKMCVGIGVDDPYVRCSCQCFVPQDGAVPMVKPSCQTCIAWRPMGFGYGYCQTVDSNDAMALTDGGALQTVPTFYCSEWKPKT